MIPRGVLVAILSFGAQSDNCPPKMPRLSLSYCVIESLRFGGDACNFSSQKIATGKLYDEDRRQNTESSYCKIVNYTGMYAHCEPCNNQNVFLAVGGTFLSIRYGGL